jgi:murein DD-endopeptidase MepM/ murein hydrolase activator NlpD
MKKSITSILLAAIFLASCSSASNTIFSKKTPHEKYEDKLEESGLEKTPEGRQWLAASDAALLRPQPISLPYRHIGNFPIDKPRALVLDFTAKRGEQLIFTLTKTAAVNFALYAELYKKDVNGSPTLLYAADTTITDFTYDVAEAGTYLLKLQPQLFHSGTYHLSVAVGPSLGFPIAGSKGSVGSFWGADRDGGKRSHEGIDIFAAKRTPAIAASDGYVTGVREGGIGGKTIWLRPENQNFTLYYAHLDEQLVREGQSVKKGDTIGLVGNTGNARYTPAHLHFGIYGYGGAVDPYPFVNRQIKTAPAIGTKKLTTHLRLVKDYKSFDVLIKKSTILVAVAITSKGYIAELLDGRLVQPSLAVVQPAVQPLKKTNAVSLTPVFTTPDVQAPSNGSIEPRTSISVFGYFNGYAFVRSGDKEGWVQEKALKG